MKLSLLVTLASDMRIQTARLNLPLKTNADFPDLGLRGNVLGKDAAFGEDFPPMENVERRHRIWMLRDSFHCHYFVGTAPEQQQVWLLGPYLTEDMNLTDINRRFERLGLKSTNMQYLYQFYSALPRIRDENLMYAIVHNHCIEMYGEEGFEIAYWDMSFTRAPQVAENEPIKVDYLRKTIEYVYAQEKLMMEYIAKGNLPGALSAIHNLEKRGVESRTTNTIRDLKNFSVVFNTLCRIAARDGGAHPADIDRISRELAIRIENASSMKELMVIREAMMKTYCSMVKEARPATFSPLIERSVEIIEAHFSNPLSLTKIAEELKVSSNYLSLRFKQEVGKTFSEYLCDKRITQAKKLLASTDLPIASVANECGFPDQNYFSRIFHRAENKTPSEYRNMNGKQAAMDELRS